MALSSRDSLQGFPLEIVKISFGNLFSSPKVYLLFKDLMDFATVCLSPVLPVGLLSVAFLRLRIPFNTLSTGSYHCKFTSLATSSFRVSLPSWSFSPPAALKPSFQVSGVTGVFPFRVLNDTVLILIDRNLLFSSLS